MSSPKISIMMPTYNAGEYIDAAILSMLSQDEVDWEMLCYDDCSDDGTFERLTFWAGMDSRIKAVQPHADHGNYIDNCNLMLDDAKGEFVARMDADDISLPVRLREQYEFIVGKPNASLIGAMALNIIEAENQIVDDYPWEAGVIKPVASRENPVNEAIRTHHRLIHGTLFSRRSTLQSLGGYEDLWPIEDWDISLKAAEAGEIYILPEILYLRRIHPSNHSKDDPNKDRAFDLINQKHGLKLEERPKTRPKHL